MKRRRKFRPVVNPLEDRLALSTAMATLAHPGTPISQPPAHHSHPSPPPSITNVSLSGTAHGSYTFHQNNPNGLTTIQGDAKGNITPLGTTTIKGSFQVSSLLKSGTELGTLTLKGHRGSLTLSISMPTSPRATTSGASVDFAYKVVSGTGQFRDAHGSGNVQITPTPAATHTNSETSQTGHGKLTLTFSSH